MTTRSLNKVTLIGNLTRDPELKYTPNGTAVCTFGIATNRSWTTSDGQIKEDVQYHRIVSWNKLAELCGKLLSKGRKVYLEGRITYRTFTGRDGVQRTVSEIVIDDFIVFSDGRRIEVNNTNQTNTTSEETNSTQKPEAPLEESKKDVEEKLNEDDIPF